ncbi:MAG: OmpH family outer membrane protein [Alphaproteobacteria bacterium]
MKFTRFIAIFIPCFIFFVFFSYCIFVKYVVFFPVKGIRMALLDIEQIKEESTPYKKARDFFSKQHENTQRDILKDEMYIRSRNEDLKKSKHPTKEKKELDMLISKLEKKIQLKKQELDKEFSILTKKLEEGLLSVIKEISEKYKIDLVLNTVIHNAPVVLHATSETIDITDKILKALNKKEASILGH